MNEAVKALLKGVSALFVLGAGTMLGRESIKNSKEAMNRDEKK